MVAEMDPFFLDVSEVGEREDLESARVCQNRPVPVHELVKPTGLFDDFMTWTNPKVIRIR